MILEIITGINLLISFVIVVLLVRKESEIRQTAKRVDLKSLQLKEQAIDMQMNNVGGLINQIAGAQAAQAEEEDEPERTPVGYAKR